MLFFSYFFVLLFSCLLVLSLSFSLSLTHSHTVCIFGDCSNTNLISFSLANKRQASQSAAGQTNDCNTNSNNSSNTSVRCTFGQITGWGKGWGKNLCCSNKNIIALIFTFVSTPMKHILITYNLLIAIVSVLLFVHPRHCLSAHSTKPCSLFLLCNIVR